MAVPKVEDLSIAILNNMQNNMEYSRQFIINDKMEIITIECDLIVHSRGNNMQQDNLIAIEMKKATNRNKRKEDKERLEYMTKSSYYNELNFEELPRHICRYAIGIFYDINIKKQQVILEYYEDGKLCKEEVLNY